MADGLRQCEIADRYDVRRRIIGFGMATAIRERVKLLDARAEDGGFGRPGEVLDDCLNIACGSGYIRPLAVQRAGRAPMTPGELLRGFPIPKGTILT